MLASSGDTLCALRFRCIPSLARWARRFQRVDVVPISNTELKAALKEAGGILAVAAEKIGTTRQNVHQRVARSPDLQAWIADIEQTLLDAAEAVVFETIVQKGDRKAARNMAKWVLTMKGKARGWSARVEHTGKDGAPLPAATVQVLVTYADPKEDVI